MKIASVDCVPLRIPFHYRPLAEPGTIRLFGRPWTHLEMLLVKVETDTGITGWGESFAFGSWRSVMTTMKEMILPMVIGRDASDINRLMFDLTIALLGMNPGMPTMAMSGLDMALWDIKGKAAGMPLHQLLGGGSTKPQVAYQSLFWSEDADLVAEVVRASVADGFRYIKLHSIEERCVRAAREAAGDDVAIMVDVNCRWTPAEARDKAMRLKQYDLFWLEEPIFPAQHYGALAQLQRDVGIPIATGENAYGALEFQSMFAAGQPAIAQPDVSMVGGITEFRKVAVLCELNGVTLRPHLTNFGPTFLATLHLMSLEARPGLIERFLIYPEALPCGDYNKPVEATFVMPDGPGLGRDPDPDVIRDYQVKDV